MSNIHFQDANRAELDEPVFVQTQATLAIAYEQRTANLIAWEERLRELRHHGAANKIAEMIEKRLEL